jgi:hypothetical protein
MIQLTYLLMNVNQRIIVATADGTIASKALSASLPSTINGMMTKAKNDTNIALRIDLDRKCDAMKPAVFSLNAVAKASIHLSANF